MKRIAIRNADPAAAERIIRAGFHPLLARLLSARGVKDPAELADELSRLIAPGSLTHVQVAASHVADAIRDGKQMLIVADYDCDGATACALGLRALRAMGASVDYLVPNRFEYGYGLTPEIVRLAASRPGHPRPDLLITVDNGIASVDGVAEANALGMRVIVTDHHLPGDRLPDALAIVNPNQPGCGFPSKHLAGVGVMFYLMLALRAELRARKAFDGRDEPRLDNLLDLVALGTVADVVKLDANNRLLVAQGLKRIRAGRMQPGIAALLRAAGRDARRAGSFDLGFGVGPRLNAAGRLADMSLGIECLTTDDPGRAWAIAEQLDEMNRQRREIGQAMQDEALAALGGIDVGELSTVCLFDPGWHQGVIGILAARVKDRFHRPTIVFAPGEERVIKGSGRSIPDVHLRDALDLVSKRAPDMIERFGGHAMAAGLTIAHDRLEAFRLAFDDAVREMTGARVFEDVLETDGSLETGFVQIEAIEAIEAQVWGSGFPAPLFCDVFDVRQQRLLKERHLKLVLARGGRTFEAIWFGHAEALPARARIVYRPDLNEYQGVTRIQLVVEHAEPA